MKPFCYHSFDLRPLVYFAEIAGPEFFGQRPKRSNAMTARNTGSLGLYLSKERQNP
jgi:hypothetical protein